LIYILLGNVKMSKNIKIEGLEINIITRALRLYFCEEGETLKSILDELGENELNLVNKIKKCTRKTWEELETF
jgi:hypothetical protein